MVPGCSNTDVSGVSIFNFPKNEEVRSQMDYACAANKSQVGSY